MVLKFIVLLSLLFINTVYSVCNKGFFFPTSEPPIQPAKLYCWNRWAPRSKPYVLPVPDMSFTKLYSDDEMDSFLGIDGSGKLWQWSSQVFNDLPDKFNDVKSSNAAPLRIGGCNLVDDKADCWKTSSNFCYEPFEFPSSNISLKSIAGSGWCAACGIRKDNDKLYCFGSNDYNQTSDAPLDIQFESVDLSPTIACGITKPEGEIKCWGSRILVPELVECGGPTMLDNIPAGGGYKYISVDFDAACAINASNHLICWGIGIPTLPTSSMFSVTSGIGSDQGGCGLTTSNDIICYGECEAEDMSCTPAPNGTFSAIASSRQVRCVLESNKCAPCWPGTFSNTISATTCQSCEVGFFCSSFGCLNCTVCPTGHVCKHNNEVPKLCPVGFYCPEASILPTECTAGTYSNETGLSTNCLNPCPAGSYCETPATRQTCPSGYYCPESSISPILCSTVGDYCPSGSSSQLPCTAGAYCPNTATIQICPAGSYCPEASTSPIPCTSGTYSNETGLSTNCLNPCPAGSYCETSASKQICPIGNYCPESSTSPAPCTSGTYSLEQGRSMNCPLCPAGSYCVTPTTIQDCPTGKFCDEGSFNANNLCPVGFYCPSSTPAPLPCSFGNYCPSEGRSSDGDPCGAQFFCPNVTTREICPSGSYCPQASTSPIPCSSGTYSSSTGRSNDCDPCPSGYYCPNTTNKIMCEAGYYCPQASISQYQCNLTYYCPSGSSSQNPCPSGSYCQTSSTKQTCVAGSYCPQSSTTPIECPLGTYSSETGRSTICTDQCPSGWYCENAGIKVQCPAGAYCPESSTNFINCSIGSYCPVNSASEQPCPSGSFCSTSEQKTICPAGSYCPESSITPAECTLGTYSSQQGRSSPCNTLCPAGSYCPNPSEIETCPPGKYCAEGSTNSSVLCRKGAYCVAGTVFEVNCTLGTYCASAGRISDGDPCDSGFYCPNVITKLECPAGSYCPIKSIAPIECQDGYYCEAKSSDQTPCSTSCPPNAPTLVSKCTRLKDRICTSSSVIDNRSYSIPWLFIIIGGVSLSTVLIISKVMTKIHPNSQPLRLFGFALAIIDLASDIVFILHIRSQIKWAFQAAAIVLILSTIIQGVYTSVFVNSCMTRQNFRDFVFERPLWFALVFLISSTNIEAFLVLSCRAFNLNMFSASLHIDQEQKIQRFAGLGVIFESIPQLFIQLAVALKLKELDGPVGFALLISLFQLLIAASKYIWLVIGHHKQQQLHIDSKYAHIDENAFYVELVD